MKKRIFLTVFATALITVLVSLILLVGVTYRYINEDTRDQLMAQLDYLSQAVDDEGLTYLNQLENNSYRITWIAADGAVLFDNRSNISRMENHADRQEFIDAKAHGVSEIERESETMTTRLMYVAEELSDGSVLRIATNDISIGGVAWMLAVPSILLILCISLLAWFVARKLSRALVEVWTFSATWNPALTTLSSSIGRSPISACSSGSSATNSRPSSITCVKGSCC